ncbi:response regulator, partial [Methylobacterium sp. Leaf361]|uniref:response regulator n=1 Tax=Methylobacterium sp. Leaf361 TaxID=1736352 RepID=UPI0012FEF89A
CARPTGSGGQATRRAEADPALILNSDHLVGAGHQAIGADGAEMARRILAEHPDVTVLLTDVVMPGETGRALVDSIRDTHPDLIVLYMTGYTRNAIVHNGMLDPGVRLLSKPFTVSDLGRELQAALEERRRSHVSSSDMPSITGTISP